MYNNKINKVMSIIRYIAFLVFFYLLILFGLKDLRYLFGFPAIHTISVILSSILVSLLELSYIVMKVISKEDNKEE